MTTDAFTTAARAEAERKYGSEVIALGWKAIFCDAAEWARDHLAADIREAQAEAWDEGRLSGEFLGVHANPYREKEADHD